MPSQLSKGRTFNPGDTVQADDLNNLVDNAIILKGAIGEQTGVTATTSDYVLITDTSDSGNLRKALISTLPSGVTTITVGLTNGSSILNFTVATPSTTPDISLGFDNQAANKFLAGPASGAATTPAFRVLSPADLPIDTVDIAASAIDWSLGNCFKKTLAANTTFTFTNPTEGQTIQVLVAQDASHTVAWPTGVSGVYWPGGTKPVMTTGVGRHDLYAFRYIGAHYWGTFDQDLLAV